MYTKRQIEDLRAVIDYIVDSPGGWEPDVGICSNMALGLRLMGWDDDDDDEAALAPPRLMKGWPLATSCPSYPVPATRGNRCPEAAAAAYNTFEKWEGEQLELRLDLLAYMRARLDTPEAVL